MAITKEILEGCKLHNATCQEQVYKHYYGYLISTGNRYITDINDIKMLVNESFFKAFTKMDYYDFALPFEIWIRKIMINTCIDFLRKNKNEKYSIPIEVSAGTFDYKNNEINIAEINIETEHLESLLKKVPETSRKVFFLFVIEGYSHKEIASLLSINEGTSKWHVNNTRNILKEQLSSYTKKNKIQKLYAK